MERWAIEIDRDDITQAVVVEEDIPTLADGEVEFSVDLVAITANNVTYAALGQPTGLLGPDAGYWDFFGARDAPGRLPVWGFATVMRSTVEGLAEGEAIYGYWPLASHAVLRPDRVGAIGFVEATPRRQTLPPFYNGYQRVSELDDHAAADHALWPIWRPLYLTGWLIADQLHDEADHGAMQVLVTDASSKTALGFAHAMRDREERPHVVALTSARSAEFVRASGLYDEVILYDAIDSVERVPSVLVDLANDPAVVRNVRHALGGALVFDLIVGFTHWDAEGRGEPFEAPPRSGFFAPGRLQKRGAEWGGQELRARIGAAWSGFMHDAPALTEVDERRGADAAFAAYEDAVAGRADPRIAVLIRT